MPRKLRNQQENERYKNNIRKKLTAQTLFTKLQQQDLGVLAPALSMFTSLLVADPKIEQQGKAISLAVSRFMKGRDNAFDKDIEALQDLDDFMNYKESAKGETMYDKLLKSPGNPIKKEELDAGLQALDSALDLGLTAGKSREDAKAVDEAVKKSNKAHLDAEADLQKKSAAEWIEKLQSEAPQYEDSARGDRKEWIAKIMAVRSLAEAERHGDSRLQSARFSEEEIEDRSMDLRNSEAYEEFLDGVTSSEERFAQASGKALHGHGGGLDDLCSGYLTMNRGLTDKDPLNRYTPTAKENIERLQNHLQSLRKAGLKAKDSLDVRQQKAQTLAHIIASRRAVKAHRGGLFGGDENLNKKLPIGDYEKLTTRFYMSLSSMGSEKLDALSALAEKGHGGKMMEEFGKELQQQKALKEQNALKQRDAGHAELNAEQAKPEAAPAVQPVVQPQQGGVQ